MAEEDLSRVQEVVACTPDWQPLALMMTSALESFGELINSWLNAAALLARDRIGSDAQETGRCDVSVRMSSIVLDAARAIEGLPYVGNRLVDLVLHLAGVHVRVLLLRDRSLFSGLPVRQFNRLQSHNSPPSSHS